VYKKRVPFFPPEKRVSALANMRWNICKIAGLLQDTMKALRVSGIQFILRISLFLFLQNIFQNGEVLSINGAFICFVLHIKLEWSSNSCFYITMWMRNILNNCCSNFLQPLHCVQCFRCKIIRVLKVFAFLVLVKIAKFQYRLLISKSVIHQKY